MKTSINVTDTIATDAPAEITVVSKTQLEAIPGVNLDDRLREVPGFTLFRRTSSLVANPTTQGVSLRGIGSSGASRTLVLWDGIPENDPFGGWLYWDRFTPVEMNSVEISRGASTSVFGDLSMGGAINIFSRPATAGHLEAAYNAGSDNTHEITVGGSDIWNRFALSGYGRAFTTDGYYIVPARLRGTADTRAAERFVAANLRLDYFSGTDRLFFRVDMLAEHRDNGTVLTRNSTGLGSLAANYAHEWSHDQLSVLGYYTQEGYRASFSSVAASRNFEKLSYTQRVPSDGEGGAALWRHSESHWHLIAGADTQHVLGTSTDSLNPTGARIGGGSVLQTGIFSQADYTVGPATFFVGAREQFTPHTDYFTPSGGFVVGHRWLRARGSVYRGFRAPTLNELYRVFRVGNILTEANAALKPETMFGAEFGFDATWGETTKASLTFYRNDLQHLITNVTLQTGATIIRQRQNAIAALSRGVEADLRHSWGPLQGQLSYLLADSRFVTGLRVSQVPKNQGSALLLYQRKGTLVSASMRSYSLQFDDDLNQFRLPGFATFQIAASQRLTRNVSLNVALENVLDRQYLVALTPTPNIGSPRLWRAGVLWTLR